MKVVTESYIYWDTLYLRAVQILYLLGHPALYLRAVQTICTQNMYNDKHNNTDRTLDVVF